jgi:hypothetical protein
MPAESIKQGLASLISAANAVAAAGALAEAAAAVVVRATSRPSLPQDVARIASRLAPARGDKIPWCDCADGGRKKRVID